MQQRIILLRITLQRMLVRHNGTGSFRRNENQAARLPSKFVLASRSNLLHPLPTLFFFVHFQCVLHFVVVRVKLHLFISCAAKTYGRPLAFRTLTSLFCLLPSFVAALLASTNGCPIIPDKWDNTPTLRCCFHVHSVQHALVAWAPLLSHLLQARTLAFVTMFSHRHRRDFTDFRLRGPRGEERGSAF